jgi:HAMP domain-containing protein
MNVLLIVGVVVFAVWFERRRRTEPARRLRRRDDEAFGRALRSPESRW